MFVNEMKMRSEDLNDQDMNFSCAEDFPRN